MAAGHGILDKMPFPEEGVCGAPRGVLLSDCLRPTCVAEASPTQPRRFGDGKPRAVGILDVSRARVLCRAPVTEYQPKGTQGGFSLIVGHICGT